MPGESKLGGGPDQESADTNTEIPVAEQPTENDGLENLAPELLKQTSKEAIVALRDGSRQHLQDRYKENDGIIDKARKRVGNWFEKKLGLADETEAKEGEAADTKKGGLRAAYQRVRGMLAHLADEREVTLGEKPAQEKDDEQPAEKDEWAELLGDPGKAKEFAAWKKAAKTAGWTATAVGMTLTGGVGAVLTPILWGLGARNGLEGILRFAQHFTVGKKLDSQQKERDAFARAKIEELRAAYTETDQPEPDKVIRLIREIRDYDAKASQEFSQDLTSERRWGLTRAILPSLATLGIGGWNGFPLSSMDFDTDGAVARVQIVKKGLQGTSKAVEALPLDTAHRFFAGLFGSTYAYNSAEEYSAVAAKVTEAGLSNDWSVTTNALGMKMHALGRGLPPSAKAGLFGAIGWLGLSAVNGLSKLATGLRKDKVDATPAEVVKAMADAAEETDERMPIEPPTGTEAKKSASSTNESLTAKSEVELKAAEDSKESPASFLERMRQEFLDETGVASLEKTVITLTHIQRFENDVGRFLINTLLRKEAFKGNDERCSRAIEAWGVKKLHDSGRADITTLRETLKFFQQQLLGRINVSGSMVEITDDLQVRLVGEVRERIANLQKIISSAVASSGGSELGGSSTGTAEEAAAGTEASEERQPANPQEVADQFVDNLPEFNPLATAAQQLDLIEQAATEFFRTKFFSVSDGDPRRVAASIKFFNEHVVSKLGVEHGDIQVLPDLTVRFNRKSDDVIARILTRLIEAKLAHAAQTEVESEKSRADTAPNKQENPAVSGSKQDPDTDPKSSHEVAALVIDELTSAVREALGQQAKHLTKLGEEDYVIEQLVAWLIDAHRTKVSDAHMLVHDFEIILALDEERKKTGLGRLDQDLLNQYLDDLFFDRVSQEQTRERMLKPVRETADENDGEKPQK